MPLILPPHEKRKPGGSRWHVARHFATIFYTKKKEGLHNYGWIFSGLIIGSIVGTPAAKRKMTAMPQMVSLFNGMQVVLVRH